jgi:hypothetical protein
MIGEPQFDHKSPRISGGSDELRRQAVVIGGVTDWNDAFGLALTGRPVWGEAIRGQHTGYPK